MTFLGLIFLIHLIWAGVLMNLLFMVISGLREFVIRI